MSELVKYNLQDRDDGTCDVSYSNGTRVSFLSKPAEEGGVDVPTVHFRRMAKWEMFEIKDLTLERFREIMTVPYGDLVPILTSGSDAERQLAEKRTLWIGKIDPQK